MKISLKIFLGYFLLVGLAAWFVLTIFVNEVKPGVRQAMEESLVDTANLLAELATPEFKAGNIETGAFSSGLASYLQRANGANIWGIPKQSSGYRVYITNKQGIVIFDSTHQAVGEDYSHWNDVYLTLRGKYGARSSLAIANKQNEDTIMYVAAPIMDGKEIIGSLTVAKHNSALLPFIERAQGKITRWGLLLFVLSLGIGFLFTWRFTRAIHRLRDYAINVSLGKKAANPISSNDELSELANAMQTMRSELDGKQHIQDAMQQLMHELKSPITAIQAASELISPGMPVQDQQHFLQNIQQQSERLQHIIQNILGLAALEHQQHLMHKTSFDLNTLAFTQVNNLQDKAALRQIVIHFTRTQPLIIEGDAFLLGQAINNLLENALAFSPNGNKISLQLAIKDGVPSLSVHDEGLGIPDYALDKIFDKFYSLPRPHFVQDAGQKSTGLGLNYVREIMLLHHGSVHIENASGGTGVIATLKL